MNNKTPMIEPTNAEIMQALMATNTKIDSLADNLHNLSDDMIAGFKTVDQLQEEVGETLAFITNKAVEKEELDEKLLPLSAMLADHDFEIKKHETDIIHLHRGLRDILEEQAV